MWFKERQTKPNVQFLLKLCSFSVPNLFLYCQTSNLGCVSVSGSSPEYLLLRGQSGFDVMWVFTCHLFHKACALEHMLRRAPAEHQLLEEVYPTWLSMSVWTIEYLWRGLLVHRPFCCCIHGVVRVTGRTFTYLQSFLWGYWVSFSQTQEPPKPVHLVLFNQSPASPDEQNHLYLLQFSSID